MSKGELWRGVTISVVIAIAFSIIGGHIIHYALEMVSLFGEDLGANARSRLIYGESHKWVHLFAAACAIAIGWFLSRRKWWMFALSLMAIVLCGAYGIQNMYGFAVKNRVSVAAVKVDEKASAQRQYENALKDLQEQISWLRQMSTQEEGRERRRLLAEVDIKRKELSALKPPVVTANNAFADTASDGFANLTNIDSNTWTFIWPLVLAVLMFLGESFSFVVVGHMVSGIAAMFATHWTAVHTARSRVSPPNIPPPSPGGGGGGKGRPADGEGHHHHPLDSSVPANTVLNKDAAVSASHKAKVSSGQPRVPASVPSAEQERDTRERVRRFLEANPDKAQSSIRALSRFTGVSKTRVGVIIKELNGHKGGLGRFRSKNDDAVRGVRTMKGAGGGVQLYAN